MGREKYALLHRHGTAGPKGRASYLKFGEYKTKREAMKSAKDYGLDGARYVLVSKVKKTEHKKLYYVTPSKPKRKKPMGFRTRGFF